MNYAVEQRMRLIDFCLAYYGHINRKMLIGFFGIGEAAASRDFSAYKKMAPSNMVYDASDQTYYKANKFSPVFDNDA